MGLVCHQVADATAPAATSTMQYRSVVCSTASFSHRDLLFFVKLEHKDIRLRSELAFPMFLVSSVRSSIASLSGEHDVGVIGEVASSDSASHQSTCTETESASASPYHDAFETLSDEDADGINHNYFRNDDDVASYGGTIIASLSSREVARNLTASMAFAQDGQPLSPTTGTRVVEKKANEVTDMETIQSDMLSFTPTMAELELSRHLFEANGDSLTCNDNDELQQHHHRAPPSTRRSFPMSSSCGSIMGITDLQPERITCPFCDREKDLQWRLSRERKQSQNYKRSENRAWFVLLATVMAFLVGFVSFLAGKAASDIQSERILLEYKNHCNEMVAQKEEDELYWKLVTAAFSAMINAMAGPMSNFVFGAHGGK